MTTSIISLSTEYNNCLDIYSNDVKKLFRSNCGCPSIDYPQYIPSAWNYNYFLFKKKERNSDYCFKNDFNNNIYKFKGEIIKKIYKDLISILDSILRNCLQNIFIPGENRNILLNGSLTQTKNSDILLKYEQIVKNQFYCMDSCSYLKPDHYLDKIWELSKYLISDTINSKEDGYSWDNYDSTFEWSSIDSHVIKNKDELEISKQILKYKQTIIFNQIIHLKKKFKKEEEKERKIYKKKYTQFYFIDNFEWANEYINSYIKPIVELILEQNMIDRSFNNKDIKYYKINRSVEIQIDDIIDNIDDCELKLYFQNHKVQIIKKIYAYVESNQSELECTKNCDILDYIDSLTSNSNISYNLFKDFC